MAKPKQWSTHVTIDAEVWSWIWVAVQARWERIQVNAMYSAEERDRHEAIYHRVSRLLDDLS